MDSVEGSDGLLHFLDCDGRCFCPIVICDPGCIMRDSAQAEKD